MGKYYTDSKAFNGHIMTEFKFNVLEVFSQHFKVHSSVVLSFKPNKIVIQTMNENNLEIKDDDVDIRGFYTTRIPSESLEEYDLLCNIPEVNVIVTKSLIKSTSKIAGGCKSINVVSNGFLLINEEIIESLVEVSFDLYGKELRRRRKVINEDINEDNIKVINDEDVREYELELLEDEWSLTRSSKTSDEIFGRVVKRPYLHYLFTSRIDYKIHRINTDLRYKSVVVRNPALFKRQYGLESRIFIAENGTILFCGCHHFSETDAIIQTPNAAPNGEFKNYDTDEEGDCEKFDHELPNIVFKYLLKFIRQIVNKGRDVIINNFEILIRRYEEPMGPIEEEPESFKIGNISFNKLIPSRVKQQLENDKRAKRREILEQNFDKRDDWSNVKPHCHALNEHQEGLMVLPEFRINHRYYSTHAIYKDFEPLRKSEHLRLDDKDEVDKPCKTRKAYDYITKMIEESKLSGKVITQNDIFKKLKKLAPELYKNYLEGEVTPVFKIDKL